MIEINSLEILIIDFGVISEPAFAADITRQDLLKVDAVILATRSSGVYKSEAMRIMAAGPPVMMDQKRILRVKVSPDLDILFKLQDGLCADTRR